jgi:colicin import membrane protein
MQGMPVEIVSPSELSQITQGTLNAPKADEQKPLVDKVAEEPKPAEEAVEKIAEKTVAAATSEPPPPPPAPEKTESKPVETKPDPIAEALKQEEAEKPPQQREKVQQQAVINPPMPVRRPPPPRPQPQFDPNKVTALLDQRERQRQVATGSSINTTMSLGLSSGRAARLSQSELDALRARLASLWSPPVGAQNPQELIVKVRVKLNRDGRLQGPPQVLNSGNSQLFTVARETAIRAIYRGQPFDMLSQETYEVWRDVEITFDPRDMFPG